MSYLLPAVDASTAIGLRVIAKVAVSQDVVAITLADPDGRRLPPWTPGAHIDVILENGATRQYSLCGDRRDPFQYQIAVLREPNGRGASQFIHDSLQVGELLGLGGPRNNFHQVPSPRYLFIAGGIGITPLKPMLTQADAVGAEWRLLYGGRTRSSMAYHDELSKDDRVEIRPQDEFGLLDLEAALSDAAPSDTKVYGCGPPRLLDALHRLCGGLPDGYLRTERFVASTPRPARDEPFAIQLHRSGGTVQVDPDTSVLEALHRRGISVLSSCQQGVCGTCEVAVLDGHVDHRDSVLDDRERAEDSCLLVCVSRARSDLLVLDI